MGKKTKILLLCPHPEGVAPGQRLKYEQYFPHLRANGFEIHVSPFMTMPFWKIVYKPGRLRQKIFWVMFGYARRVWDLCRIPFYDGTFVFLNVTPLGGPFFERLVRLLSRKLVYDIDDLVFLGKTSAVNKVVSRFKSSDKYFYLMKASDHVISCTPYLDGIVRRYNSHTTDISSTIATDRYLPVNTYSNENVVTIGWSGSHSTSVYMKLLSDVLAELKKKRKFKLLVIGDANFQMPGIDVEALPWREESEVRDLQRIDIGLYPLPDEEWVYGKSGLKALQYMALGIPTIATAIGANFRVMEDGISGFLVKSDAEWLARLEQLVDDASLRKSIGTKARERVEELYSVRANEPTYLKIFQTTFL